MSFHDPEDRSIYQEEVFETKPMSHGLITIADWDQVIELRNAKAIFERNKPSPRDGKARLSLVFCGGVWRYRPKIRTPRNAVAMRFDDTEENKAHLDELMHFITPETAKKFLCTK